MYELLYIYEINAVFKKFTLIPYTLILFNVDLKSAKKLQAVNFIFHIFFNVFQIKNVLQKKIKNVSKTFT